MRTKDDIAVIQAMGIYGGSFMQAIGRACELADDDNLAKIKAAFPDEWGCYVELARLRAERQKASA